MLLIIASAADDDARSLLPHFHRFEPVLVTPADLWQSGWQLRTDAPASGAAIANDRRVSVADIGGVISLLPVVLPQELLVISPDSRDYVAQEMTAFLRYFLVSLRCPVLNRATAGSLCGSSMRTEAWLQLAASNGIPIDRWVRGSRETREPSNGAPGDIFTVTVIGESVVEEEHAVFLSQARTLARAASVGMLALRFRRNDEGEGSRFCGVEACPRLAGSRSAALLEDYFAARGIRS